MSKGLQIPLFIIIPGIVAAAIMSILRLINNESVSMQSAGTSFLIGASIGVILIILRLLVKGNLWGSG
ncbi:hypothetical protein [Oceanobacillus jeddahense]|uniref:Uncharacterized protein n=1 Tax=Oceanobacillus jeddahense TaxID=1462527 RepID=A0ABY5JS50_9BACI|nr:hypothetical protein [Oceanobacillus jeddahense]UUI03123.1 hypothetical protein NP439_24355 [Oceanobacillus jeddahense]